MVMIDPASAAKTPLLILVVYFFRFSPRKHETETETHHSKANVLLGLFSPQNSMSGNSEKYPEEKGFLERSSYNIGILEDGQILINFKLQVFCTAKIR